MKQLILIRGIPGSGKSTLAKKLFRQHNITDYAYHFEADMFFETDEGYKFDSSKIKDAHAWCQKMADDHLENDAIVIVSNTFTTAWEMEPYFKISKKHGIVPVVHIAQNRFKNVHGVPEEVLQKMRDRFEYRAVDALMEKYGT